MMIVNAIEWWYMLAFQDLIPSTRAGSQLDHSLPDWAFTFLSHLDLDQDPYLWKWRKCCDMLWYQIQKLGSWQRQRESIPRMIRIFVAWPVCRQLDIEKPLIWRHATWDAAAIYQLTLKKGAIPRRIWGGTSSYDVENEALSRISN